MADFTPFIATVGTIVAAFFLLSLAVETILENFRGLLSLFGIQTLNAKMTMEAALAEAAEFVHPDSKEFAKFAGLANFVKQRSKLPPEDTTKIKGIIDSLTGVIPLKPDEKQALVEKEKIWLSTLAGPVQSAMQKSEEKRVFVLRILSAVLGVGIASAVGLNVLDMAGTDGASKAWAQDPLYRVAGYVLGGLAAAGGSSFWHDQLDRIRNLKSTAQQLVALR